MKITVSKKLKNNIYLSTLQEKVDRLYRLYNYAKQFRANNEYDLKIDLERAEQKLTQAMKEG